MTKELFCKVVVVVATGTDVGKTHVTCALLAYLKSRGVRAIGYKPVASGVDPDCEDTIRHAEASAIAEIPPSYSYLRPVSPHLAAREEGRPIDLAVLVMRARELANDAANPLDVLVVESAGGLFSPLAKGVTNLDLARALAPAKVLLVAADRLGALHDVRSTLLAAAASGLAVDAVVFSAPPVPDGSTGSNAAELEAVFETHAAAVFPRERFDSPASREAASAAFGALTAHVSPQSPAEQMAR